MHNIPYELFHKRKINRIDKKTLSQIEQKIEEEQIFVWVFNMHGVSLSLCLILLPSNQFFGSRKWLTVATLNRHSHVDVMEECKSVTGNWLQRQVTVLHTCRCEFRDFNRITYREVCAAEFVFFKPFLPFLQQNFASNATLQTL